MWRGPVGLRCGTTSVGGLMQGPAGPMFNEASNVPVNGWCPCVMAVTSLLNARTMSTFLASVVGAVPAGCHCMCSGGEALENKNIGTYVLASEHIDLVGRCTSVGPCVGEWAR